MGTGRGLDRLWWPWGRALTAPVPPGVVESAPGWALPHAATTTDAASTATSVRSGLAPRSLEPPIMGGVSASGAELDVIGGAP